MPLNDGRSLDDGAHIAEANNEEGDTLEEEVDVVTPLAIHKIIAPNGEEEYSNYQLQEVHSVKSVSIHQQQHVNNSS